MTAAARFATPAQAPLSGHLAWVTGAGSGIGRAIAETLAAAGATVALTGRTAATLSETAGMIGAAAFVQPADVTDAAAVAAAHEAIVARAGPVAILVNNAGWNLPERHWRQLTPANVERLTAINFTAPFLCTLAVLPGMRARGGGFLAHIVSLSATGIFVVSGPAYTAAKHGARAMSATINAEEGIHGIRSVCINPGETETPLLYRRPVQPTPEQIALLMQPQDVADAVLFCVMLPPRACVTELTIAPTDNNFYRADARRLAG